MMMMMMMVNNNNIKKVTFSLYLTKHYAMKTYWGSTDSRFLDLGTSWSRRVSFTPLLLYLRENNTRYPWWAPEPVWMIRGNERK
jgi:hypothetical protein